MDSNTHSTQGAAEPPDDLAALTAVLDRMAARDLERLPEAARAERVMVLGPMVERLVGQWLKELAGVDARGAAGAEQGVQFGSTAGWLRGRLRMRRQAATTAVRTARALFRGPLPASGTALCAGEFSVAHAQVLAAGTKDLADHVAADAEATLLDAARRLDPTGLRRLVAHLQYTVDPDGADAAAQRRYARRGVWVTTTFDRMVAVRGLLAPEAGQTLLAALDPLARPADHHDTRTGGQRTADALAELARRQLEAGQLPKTGGVRPQLSVIVDLKTVTGDAGGLGGDIGGAGPLEPQACRRLACDATITRIIVSRQPPRPVPAAKTTTPRTRPAQRRVARDGCRPSWPPSPRSWAGLPAAPWTWAARPGSSARPNAAPWPCGTVAVSSPAVPGRWPGAKPTTSGIG
jgi:hypothetical protein